MQKTIIILGTILFVAILSGTAAIWYPSDTTTDRRPTQDQPHSRTGEANNVTTDIDWDATTIRNQDGVTLLTADDVPTSVQLANGSEFGVAGNIADATLSPDNTWVAFTMSGAAHGSAWLYHTETDDLQAIGFQYGGGFKTLPWSPDGRFIALQANSPAGTNLLKVVDRGNLLDAPDATGFVLEVPQEAQKTPPFSYTFNNWREPDQLCFTFSEREYCANVSTQEIAPQ